MLSEYVVLHENALVHLPAYLSYIEAASLPCAAVSAWSALNVATPLQPGKSLIKAPAEWRYSGFKLPPNVRARVLAITSSAEKAEKLKTWGRKRSLTTARFQIGTANSPAYRCRGVDKVIDSPERRRLQNLRHRPRLAARSAWSVLSAVSAADCRQSTYVEVSHYRRYRYWSENHF